LEAQARESAGFREEVEAVLLHGAGPRAVDAHGDGGAAETETGRRLSAHIQRYTDHAARLTRENCKLKDEVAGAGRLLEASEARCAATERGLAIELEAQARKSARFREEVKAVLLRGASPRMVSAHGDGGEWASACESESETVTILSAHMQRHAEDAAGLARENAKLKNEVARAARARKSSETKRAAAARDLTEQLEAQTQESARFREDIEAVLRDSPRPQAASARKAGEAQIDAAEGETAVRLRAHIQRHTDGAAGLARENAGLRSEIARTTRRLAACAGEAEAAREELRAEARRLRDENARLTDDGEQALETARREGAERVRLVEATKAVTAASGELRTSLADVSKRLSSAQAGLERSLTENARLADDAERAARRVGEERVRLAREVEAATAASGELRASLADVSKRLAVAKAGLDRSLGENARLADDAKQAAGAARRMGEERARLAREVEAATAGSGELRASLAGVSKRLAAAKAELERSQAENARLTDQAERAVRAVQREDEERERLVREVEAVTASSRKLRAGLAGVSKRLAAAKAELDRSQDENARLSGEVERAVEAARREGEERTRLAQEAESAAASNRELRANLADSSKRLAAAKGELGRSLTANARLTEDVKQARAAAQLEGEERARLAREVEAVKVSTRELRAGLADSSKRLAAAKAELDRSQAESARLSGEVERAARREGEERMRGSAKLADRVGALAASNKTLRVSLASVSGRLAEAGPRLSRALAENARLRADGTTPGASMPDELDQRREEIAILWDAVRVERREKQALVRALAIEQKRVERLSGGVVGM